MPEDPKPARAGAAGDSVYIRLSRVAGMLQKDSLAAANAASDILDEIPGQQQALFLLVSALRLLKEEATAARLLEWMAQNRPKLASIHYELAILWLWLGRRREATERLSTVLSLEPNHAAALRALGDRLATNGDGAAAGRAYAQSVKLFLRELLLLEEMTSKGVDELINLESSLRASLAVNPTDVHMRHMMAGAYLRLARWREAQMHLARALELAPDFKEARRDYAIALSHGGRHREANEQLELLMDGGPQQTLFACEKANNLIMRGDYESAFAILEQMTKKGPANPLVWLHYGHALRAVAGRSAEAVRAYQRGIEIDPGFGASWWALANLKSYRFSPAEVETMEAQAARRDIDDQALCPLEFALGHAMESGKAWAPSFEHYRRGNTAHRRNIRYDGARITTLVRNAKSVMSPEFFQSKAGLGLPAPDPIFIVGMARAGSTLVEQILASHSLVEGTKELHDLPDVVAELQMRHPEAKYPALLSTLEDHEFRKLGERYLELSRSQRKLPRRFFTDKAGSNFLHVGLIQVILPHAKIIDARRHPLACCFSSYKQIFPVGSCQYSYDLAETAQFYRDYVELMAHFDRVLPGRVHRVFHEDMIRDPATEIRRLLAHCGLPYEEQCERFYESDRAVLTVSSEQVRRPIDPGAGEHWRNFEPWLGPAAEALGDVLTLYPAVPKFE